MYSKRYILFGAILIVVSTALIYCMGRVNDVKPVAVIASSTINVTTSDGVPVIIDIRSRPVLYFSAGCKHCDDVLKDVAVLNPKQRPYLVGVYQGGGEVKQKLAANGLDGENYYLAQKLPEELQLVPSILTWDGEKKHAGNIEDYI